MPQLTVDSSCIVAVIQAESGAEAIMARLQQGDCVMSTVNVAEVAAKLAERGATADEIDSGLSTFGLEFLPFDAAQAVATGMLRPTTRSLGLSLGDRACLSLAIALGTPVLTTDRAWASLSLPIDVILAR